MHAPHDRPDLLPSSDAGDLTGLTDPTGLLTLGWDDTWSSALVAATDLDPPPHERVARVCRAGRGTCDVLVAGASGPRTLTADWSPPLRRAVAADPTAVPAAGDWVLLDGTVDQGGHDPGDGARPGVALVLPRRTAVVRAQVAAGSSHEQVLAANADVAAVVEPMAPDVDLARVERLLALAWSSGARPVVVLTKSDLVALPDALRREVADVAPGADVHAVSAAGDVGLEPLRALLASGATVALLGASGAGKSTLLNALVGTDVMRTNALRTDGKGRHTTVTRELHLAPGGGAVLDTPGLRTVGLAGHEALDDVFTEIDELAAGCRFADCAHEHEPGCAVLAAVEDGDLPERRLLSYRKLLREAEHQAARVDARLRAEAAGRIKARTKAYRRQHVRP
ncbi:ribosome small subunit-dependent GTPase A [Actinotalea solisilvae]|uniref:ribosome small subunit-dependent GTPase A n=1 Tax=Actinotalea solisilvae TaxID=2072922 RepID=UPI0018F11DFF|nr:ribosome small subunit-dependent GTPase A [Actinotalea solisilvae]